MWQLHDGRAFVHTMTATALVHSALQLTSAFGSLGKAAWRHINTWPGLSIDSLMELRKGHFPWAHERVRTEQNCWMPVGQATQRACCASPSSPASFCTKGIPVTRIRPGCTPGEGRSGAPQDLSPLLYILAACIQAKKYFYTHQSVFSMLILSLLFSHD